MRVAWYDNRTLSPAWDAAEVKVRMAGSLVTLCPFIAEVPGPDERWVFSVDVPAGRHEIRSLACGFAESRKKAKAAAVDAMRRVARGPRPV
ncbi:hypothetical protein [Rhizobium sp. 2TAF27]|uniref:hypothetical protein n=1 Tax=Rhizobium sp. 2TAF27 TaxID=3233013 RepID=UPI003F9A463C